MGGWRQDQTVFARQYAQRYGIPAQTDQEDDNAFRERVAAELKKRGKNREAYEAGGNQLYVDENDVMTSSVPELHRHLFGHGQVRDARARVRELMEEGKTGVEIAKVLLQEDYAIGEAHEAFFDLGFVVMIEPFTTDRIELYVSDRPMSSLAVIILSTSPLALPSVDWQKKVE